MPSLKTGVYEVIAALGLLAVIEFYLSIQHDPLIINPTLVMGELITVYLLIAVASEGLIVAGLRPTLRQSVIFNTLVAAIIMQSVWNHPHVLKALTGIAVITAILRMFVSTASLRAPKMRVRRFTSILVGGPLLLGTVWTGINLAEGAYYSYYFFPKFKESYIMPTRWQDIVSLVVLWGGTILVLYLSYRLLKYAFRNKPAVPAQR
jgi:hypothetical protein